MSSQVLHFVADALATRQSRVLLLSSDGVSFRFFKDFRLAHPNMKVGRNLTDKGLLTAVESVEKDTTATVKLIECPSLHRDPIAAGLIK